MPRHSQPSPPPSPRRRGSRAAVAALGLGTASLLGWTAAASASAPTGAFDKPSVDGAVLSANPVTVSGTFQEPNGIMDDVSVSVGSNDGHPVTNGSADFPCHCGQPSESFFLQVTLPYNGSYTATAIGTGETRPPDGTGAQHTTVTRTFYVSIAPTTPSGVTTQVDNSARTVQVSWNANPEPDIYGYLINRKDPSSSSFRPLVGIPPATTWTDKSITSAPAGDYQYEIIAVRKTGDGKGYLESAPSSSADAALTSPPPTTAPPPSHTSGTGGASSASGTGSAGSGTGDNGNIVPGGRLAPAPPLPAPARADAGDFSQLLAQARAVTTVPAEPGEGPDTGFSENLPFAAGSRATSQLVPVPGGTQLAGGQTLGGEDGGSSNRRTTYEYLAGALVLLVLAMHATYLKRQAERFEALEAIPVASAPEDVASAPEDTEAPSVVAVIGPQTPAPRSVHRAGPRRSAAPNGYRPANGHRGERLRALDRV